MIENTLKRHLKTLGFRVNLPEDSLDLIMDDCITRLGSDEVLNLAEAEESFEFEEHLEGEGGSNGKSTGHSREIIQNSVGMTNEDTMNNVSFASLMAAHIRQNYSGDPLALRPFLASIDYLKDMATTDALLTQLKKFVLTKLEGYASEIVPFDVASIDVLTQTLEDKIKPVGSKIVEGRMIALRCDRSNVQNFATQVEDLADAFRRALVTDSMPHALAESQVIDKTVQLCRSNARSETVKTILASTKEVLFQQN